MEGFNLNSNSEEEQLFVLYHHLFMNDQEGLHKFLSNHLTPGCSYAQKYHIFLNILGVTIYFFGFLVYTHFLPQNVVFPKIFNKSYITPE